ncbi:T9SS type A sorting domain-containing protein [Dyadobacter arcticus]|uniref:Secretion system C-terminal sorting domain-containing protein n=1 Tax=Dyadobacter arcticus TaxID=1078754 RepID=A0ABX0UNM6_9BACT|nr:T9SS type A sorting domain-containing protein [Dyadobacter arcticus]NIJ54587.1 hypothetical protein [Dyadobacter arcticus]
MKTRRTGLNPRYSAYCFLLLPFVFSFQMALAQQGSVSSGGNATGSGGSVSYSVGQVFYISNTAAGGTVSAGVQQAFNDANLPVTLISFEALPITIENRRQVLIRWETSSEFNNDFFTIERSVDGTTFAEAMRVSAEGNSTTLKKYSWTDPLPHPGTSYYRLKQTDFDRTFAYSRIRAVRTQNMTETLVYPNPVNSYLHVSNAKTEVRSYKIFDLGGRLIGDSQLLKEGIINVSQLSPAAYIIQIFGKSVTEHFTIIKN